VVFFGFLCQTNKKIICNVVDKNNLTIVPELGTADNDDDKVRDVVGIYRVNISHEYDYVVVAFEINTNLEQVKK
jgi:hypothetical protein